jgi:hypothetical protein
VLLEERLAPRLLDLTACSPGAALTSELQHGAWQAVPFELTDGRGGTLLYAGPETQAPPLTLPLHTSGVHRVSVGLWSNWTSSTVRLKLSRDPAFHTITRERADNFVIDECVWREVDLTGQSLQIAQQSAGVSQPACLAYVVLERVEAPDTSHPDKPLIAMDDAFSFFHMRRPTTREAIWEELQPYVGTDFTRIFWGTGVGGDQACYLSPTLPLVGTQQADFPRVGDRHVAESLRTLAEAQIDPLATALEFAHANGLELHVGHRMEAFQMCAPFDAFFTGSAWHAHPEWRCRDKDGSEIARLSYAFPGVRALVLDIFEEILQRYAIDGINPLFNRGAPFLLYEPPLLDDFRRQTGLDARELEDRDPRYVAYRASVMTSFMRDLRARCDKPISAHVLNSVEENLFYGLDLEAWVREGLVDRLIAYPWRDKALDVPAFVDLVSGTGVEFFSDVMPRFMSADTYRQRAAELYAAGVDGLCFWDTDQRSPRLTEWTALRRLGHLDDLQHRTETFRTVPLRSVGGMRLDKYPPHWAY